MRQLIVISSLLLLLLGCNNSPVDQNPLDSVKGNRNIVLMHPTVRNVKTFLFLTEKGIFPLPTDYEVIGVYHSKGSYNYEETASYLEKEGIKKIHLVEVKHELSPDNIYKLNDCTPLFREIFDKTGGAIFFGGPDIPPSCYGEPTNLLTIIEDPYRHYVELSMLFHMLGGSQDTTFQNFLSLSPDYRLLGICLGMQSMNVATGGTMVQDIPTEIFGISTLEEILALDKNEQHRNYNTNWGIDNDLIWGYLHQIRFDKRSLLDSLNGFSETLPFIWSSHHQGVEKIGKGIIPVAWSLDGKIIEAVIHSKYPNVMGVQFHPEIPSIYKPEDKLSTIPFEQNKKSYIDLYSSGKGEDFHREFWKYFGELFK